MLDFLLDAFGEAFLEAFFAIIAAVFSGLWDMGDIKGGPEMLSVVPRLPIGAGVLLAKGGN